MRGQTNGGICFESYEPVVHVTQMYKAPIKQCKILYHIEGLMEFLLVISSVKVQGYKSNIT